MACGAGNEQIDIAVAIEISGTGLYRCSRLLSSEADVEVTGAGQAFVWAETRLDARANGRGRVVYRGAPTVTSAVQRDGVVTALADARIDVGR